MYKLSPTSSSSSPKRQHQQPTKPCFPSSSTSPRKVSPVESHDFDPSLDTRCNNDDSPRIIRMDMDQKINHQNPYGLSVRVRPSPVDTSLPVPSPVTSGNSHNTAANNKMTMKNGNSTGSHNNSGCAAASSVVVVAAAAAIGGSNSGSNVHKSLPPLFYYMETGDFRRAAERAKNHPREVRTWASIKIKSSSIGQHSTKRLALHQACFKVSWTLSFTNSLYSSEILQ
jgi:hypothetical protein